MSKLHLVVASTILAALTACRGFLSNLRIRLEDSRAVISAVEHKAGPRQSSTRDASKSIQLFTAFLAVHMCGASTARVEAQPGPANVTRHAAHDRYPAWRPDGSGIAFETDRDRSWNIYLIGRGGANPRPLVTSAAHDRQPAWHPDGNRLVFQSDRTGRPQLFVLDMTTGETRQLTDLEGEPMFPDWSPDGRFIAFTLVTDGRFTIVRIREDGSDLTPLVETPGRHVWPRWSPDGRRVAWFARPADDEGDDDLFAVNLTDGAIQRLTERDGHDFCPVWAPNGDRLAAISVEPSGARRIRILDADGRVRGELAGGMYRVTEPAWSPDGRSLAYAAQRTQADAYEVFVLDVPTEVSESTSKPAVRGEVPAGAKRLIAWLEGEWSFELQAGEGAPLRRGVRTFRAVTGRPGVLEWSEAFDEQPDRAIGGYFGYAAERERFFEVGQLAGEWPELQLGRFDAGSSSIVFEDEAATPEVAERGVLVFHDRDRFVYRRERRLGEQWTRRWQATFTRRR